MTSLKTIAVSMIWLAGAAAECWAVTVPFTEHFGSDTANWKNVASLDLMHVANGGPDGSGFVTTDTAFTSAVMGSTILFRGHDLFDSSEDAFVGDWLAADVRRLSAYVRHNAPEPLDFLARIATPFNFPGVIFSAPSPVPADTWTLLEFEISPTNPLATVEGPPSNYNATLSNVGNVQIGARVPLGREADSTPYTFDLDQVSIAVPEPVGVLLLLGIAGVSLTRHSVRRI